MNCRSFTPLGMTSHDARDDTNDVPGHDLDGLVSRASHRVRNVVAGCFLSDRTCCNRCIG
jgi:hypothetical protein